MRCGQINNLVPCCDEQLTTHVVGWFLQPIHKNLHRVHIHTDVYVHTRVCVDYFSLSRGLSEGKGMETVVLG